MKENKYDQEAFFSQYSRMTRSVEGLKGAGEWHEFRKLLPAFDGKRVLDLGCGFGWHCGYAVEQGASAVTGIDLSRNMLEEAARRNPSPYITYECVAVEEYAYPAEAFDIVLSSLALHYVSSFAAVCEQVYRTLVPGGHFVFSVEHPVFTAYGNQDWFYDEQGNKLHWPVDRYFTEGKRTAVFLGEEVTKYHNTLTTYLNELVKAGFRITGVVEPQPDPALLDRMPGMRDELRRPMMLLVSAVKPPSVAGG
ncbi:MAG: class I SAM-dependent methyltransferase [Tannerellaceae bacterium]|nr:class I SAM-dependent methyltransferase [Tannerellaceae bacterium]